VSGTFSLALEVMAVHSMLEQSSLNALVDHNGTGFAQGCGGGVSKEETIGIPGRNDFQREVYAGRCPPPQHGQHRYVLRL
jgi:phosphatidylethanolamine-binding protein (PEBP) family uncharacterized protein